jgi:sialate O-acetylesterase
MIQDWRKRWGNEFAFLGVQLAPFWDGNSEGVRYAELRDAQLLATKLLPKVGLAVITDVGDEKDIHPQQKEPVGVRLALAARALAYGEKIVYSGPIYREAKFEGKKAILSFDHVGGGLVAKDGPLVGFTACGTDRVFKPARAVIEGQTVVVTCDEVDQIVAVRYGWANFPKPTLNLFNKEGLPASPFRTDDFPLTTQPKTQK